MDLDWKELCKELKVVTDEYTKEKQRRFDEEVARVAKLYEEADEIIRRIPSLVEKNIKSQDTKVTLFEGTDYEGMDRSDIISSRIKKLLEDKGVVVTFIKEESNLEYDNYDSYYIEVAISELTKLINRVLK